MIRYRLQCHTGHEFEAWFSNSGAYDLQATRGQVLCPDCGSANVSKAPMAPRITTRKEVAANVTATEPEAAKRAEPQHKILALMREVRAHVERNAEYVGSRFAEEARKMHFNETKARGIYGEATPDDVRQLADDGIEFSPLPRLPEDHD